MTTRQYRDRQAVRTRRVLLSRRAVAQWLEQGTHNPSVVGSIPTGPTNETKEFHRINFTAP